MCFLCFNRAYSQCCPRQCRTSAAPLSVLYVYTMGIGGSKKSLKEQMRENKRMINKSIRELDRERTKLQNQEKKLVVDIKKAAKANEMKSVRQMATDLVRTRQYITKFYGMRSQLQAVQLKLEVARTTEAMTSAMTGVTKALGQMNRQMNIPQMQQVMQDFQKNQAKAEMQQEMMDDVVDQVMEGDEEEEEQIVSQVLAEIGVEIGGAVPEAPTGPAAVAAPPAAAPAVPAQPAAVAGAAGGGGGAADTQVSELEARLNNLRR